MLLSVLSFFIILGFVERIRIRIGIGILWLKKGAVEQVQGPSSSESPVATKAKDGKPIMAAV